MSNENGPILTDTKKNVLQGKYDAPTRQAEYDHRQTIHKNIQGVLSDFQWLSCYADQTTLIEMFGEGCESDAGLVPRLEHVRPPMDELIEQLDTNRDQREASKEELRQRRPFGWISDEQGSELAEHIDEQGRVVPEEEYPEAQTKLEQIADRLLSANKASPETQEALIESVAFICRAAEAGELYVERLIERGVERYYQRSPTKEGQMVSLKKWPEEQWVGILEREGNDRTPDTTPVPTYIEERYLEREG